MDARTKSGHDIRGGGQAENQSPSPLNRTAVGQARQSMTTDTGDVFMPPPEHVRG